MRLEKLTCAFGLPWGAHGCGPCAKCKDEADKMDREFQRAVFFGEHDERGYRPREKQRTQEH